MLCALHFQTIMSFSLSLCTIFNPQSSSHSSFTFCHLTTVYFCHFAHFQPTKKTNKQKLSSFRKRPHAAMQSHFHIWLVSRKLLGYLFTSLDLIWITHWNHSPTNKQKRKHRTPDRWTRWMPRDINIEFHLSENVKVKDGTFSFVRNNSKLKSY